MPYQSGPSSSDDGWQTVASLSEPAQVVLLQLPTPASSNIDISDDDDASMATEEIRAFLVQSNVASGDRRWVACGRKLGVGRLRSTDTDSVCRWALADLGVRPRSSLAAYEHITKTALHVARQTCLRIAGDFATPFSEEARRRVDANGSIVVYIVDASVDCREHGDDDVDDINNLCATYVVEYWSGSVPHLGERKRHSGFFDGRAQEPTMESDESESELWLGMGESEEGAGLRRCVDTERPSLPLVLEETVEDPTSGIDDAWARTWADVGWNTPAASVFQTHVKTLDDAMDINDRVQPKKVGGSPCQSHVYRSSSSSSDEDDSGQEERRRWVQEICARDPSAGYSVVDSAWLDDASGHLSVDAMLQVSLVSSKQEKYDDGDRERVESLDALLLSKLSNLNVADTPPFADLSTDFLSEPSPMPFTRAGDGGDVVMAECAATDEEMFRDVVSEFEGGEKVANVLKAIIEASTRVNGTGSFGDRSEYLDGAVKTLLKLEGLSHPVAARRDDDDDVHAAPASRSSAPFDFNNTT